jgi:enoyl-CoA hydratase/carnithine racemase
MKMAANNDGLHDSDPFFTTEEIGAVSVLRLREKKGLFGESLRETEQVMEYLNKVEKYRKKVLVIFLPRDFLSPRDMEEFWSLVKKRSHQAMQETPVSEEENGWDLIRKENAFHQFCTKIQSMSTFVICAFQGTTFFSFIGVPLACDYRIVTSNSEFTCRCMEAGLPPGSAYPWFLARYIGQGWASRILYEESPITAAQMLEMGLVNQIVETPHWETATLGKAKWFASMPANGLIAAKRMMNATSLPLQEYLELEERELERCLHSKSNS